MKIRDWEMDREKVSTCIFLYSNQYMNMKVIIITAVINHCCLGITKKDDTLFQFQVHRYIGFLALVIIPATRLGRTFTLE